MAANLRLQGIPRGYSTKQASRPVRRDIRRQYQALGVQTDGPRGLQLRLAVMAEVRPGRIPGRPDRLPDSGDTGSRTEAASGRRRCRCTDP